MNSSLQQALDAHSSELMSHIRTGNLLKRTVARYMHPVRRRMFEQLHRYVCDAQTPRVCILYGLRRTGKTTLMLQSLNALPEDDFYRAAYISGDIKFDTMTKLWETLRLLERHGVDKVYIDEATAIDGFASSAGALVDIYGMSGMKIVLAGTDSLLFSFSKEHALFDRAITIRTTNILFLEHAEITGKNDILNFIDSGGILSEQDGICFSSIPQCEKYSLSSIAYNIQNSLERDTLVDRYRDLAPLYNRGHLTNIINRIVNDINNRFVVDVLRKNFTNEQIGFVEYNIGRKHNLKHCFVDLEKILHASDIFERFMYEFSILNNTEKNFNYRIENCHLDQIIEYLEEMSLLRHYSNLVLDKKNNINNINKPFIVLPGLRYRQCESFARMVSKKEEFKGLAITGRERDEILDLILNTVRGKILEETVIFEALESCPKDHDIFQYRDNPANAEFDLVIRNKESKVCDLYEIKLADFFTENHARHLRDEKVLERFRMNIGEIASRTVLYRGSDMNMEDGVRWRNVEIFLKDMARQFPTVGFEDDDVPCP